MTEYERAVIDAAKDFQGPTTSRLAHAVVALREDEKARPQEYRVPHRDRALIATMAAILVGARPSGMVINEGEAVDDAMSILDSVDEKLR